MRYFIELAYQGTRYAGWQSQPNAVSVQQTVEEAMSTILRKPTHVVGCGRTDTGVHASQFFLHFDLEEAIPSNFLSRINKYLPPDIAFRQIFPVRADAHARFDAIERSYTYHLHFQKDPFLRYQSHYFPYGSHQIDMTQLQSAAKTLLNFRSFYPFCKAHSDARTMNCHLQRSEWVWSEGKRQLLYHITADRFLRGMVRLIVGMCLNVSRGRLSVEEVQQALEKQQRLHRNYSAPAEGLFLTKVNYDKDRLDFRG